MLLASWCAPAALAAYATAPQHACCRRGGHHCPQSSEQNFRDAKMHCRYCHGLVTVPQAARPQPAPVTIAPHDEHPFVHEFLSAYPSVEPQQAESERAPPADPSR